MKAKEAARAKVRRKERGQIVTVTRRASYLVNMAVKRGLLKPASDFKCVDCGWEASMYDHRFYTRPLDVVPVCGSCNKLRGSAWDLEMIQGDIDYTPSPHHPRLVSSSHKRRVYPGDAAVVRFLRDSSFRDRYVR